MSRPPVFGDVMQALTGHKKAPLYPKGAFLYHLYYVEGFASLRSVPEKGLSAYPVHWHGINKNILICRGNGAQDKKEVKKTRSNAPLGKPGR
ncbi:hypothetical protein [Desulfovibrio piger]|uniref:hypothetical protein n=1 Tax=Desulfovibrio piger TaxID=901 RepID=UPI0026EA124B|nr:hypothetical protein [Desulfovibrio piger]